MQRIEPIIVDETLITFLKGALAEDGVWNDITTKLIVLDGVEVTAEIYAKEGGVLAGLPIVKVVFELVDEHIKIEPNKEDGDEIAAGDVICTIFGKARAILSAERLSLNILQHLSGIATLTARLCEKVKPYGVKIYDTRKTLPNLRVLQRYAVRVGGGYNHRFNLSETILIKDNHIKLANGVANAVALARQADMEVEVEVKNLAQLNEALSLMPEAILLDNMPPESIKQAVQIIRSCKKNIIIEVSGNINEGNIAEYACLGIDRISVGYLTHSAKAIDFSLEII